MTRKKSYRLIDLNSVPTRLSMNTSIRKFNGRVDTQNNPYGIGIQTYSLFEIFTFIPRVQNKDETENEQRISDKNGRPNAK